jgi:nucleolar protein 56
MKVYVVRSLIGVFGIDANGELIDYVLFPKDVNLIAQRITEDGLNPEERDLIAKLKKKNYTELISSKKNDAFKFDTDKMGEKLFRENFRPIIKKIHLSDLALNEQLTEIGIRLTKIRIKEAVKKDKIIIQVVDAIDEIDKSLNIFTSRLREWYGLHFPEMESTVEKHERFVKLVSEYGSRENIDEKELKQIAKTSMGVDFSEKDEVILKEYATKIKELYKLREHLEKYVDQVLKEIAPNLREIASSLLAARLIALTGGLEKLAKKPSSTIQLLGAEKALFRFLHGRGRSPKYGLLFTHQLIQNTPPEKRGKVARVLASKISIAAKMDFYGKKVKSDELKKDLEDRIKMIMGS